MEQIGKQEIELLRSLQKNSRFEISELTERLNMSRTSVYDKIKKLENDGYIKGYTAVVDQKMVGLNFTVIVNISLESQRLEYVDEFLERISILEEVMEAYVIGGLFDLVLKVIVKDHEAYADFIAQKLSAIPHISKIQSSFVMRCIKQQSALPF